MSRFVIRLIGCLVVCVLSSAAHADKSPPSASIQGSWTITGLEDGFTTVTGEGSFCQIDDKTITFGPETVKLRYYYAVDTSKHPHEINLYHDEAKKTLLQHGIYQVTDDTLKICYASVEYSRPSEFKVDKGGQAVLKTFKRKK